MEVGGRRLEDRGQRLYDRGRRTEIGWRSEVRGGGQRWEVRVWRSEV